MLLCILLFVILCDGCTHRPKIENETNRLCKAIECVVYLFQECPCRNSDKFVQVSLADIAPL